MIDFRYHLVSLISVFLALAVGVVLGAGPLQNSIGTALEDQVAALRSDRDAVRAERDDAVARADRGEEYLAAVAPTLIDGALAGHRVALVTLPGANGDDVTRAAEAVVTAGGQIVSRVEVGEAWVDPARLQYRTTLAGQLLGYLDPAPSADAGADGVLAAALAQGLSRPAGDPATPEGVAPAPDGLTLLEMLRGGDTPLVTLVQEPSAAAEDVLVIGPRPEPAAEDDGATATPTAGASAGSGTEAELERAAWVSLARGLARTAPGAAIVGSAAEGDLVASVRADEPAAAEVTTVDSVDLPSMPVTAALALAADAAGTVGHFGYAESAQALVPARAPAAP